MNSNIKGGAVYNFLESNVSTINVINEFLKFRYFLVFILFFSLRLLDISISFMKMSIP